jgi:hypothetical protein
VSSVLNISPNPDLSTRADSKSARESYAKRLHGDSLARIFASWLEAANRIGAITTSSKSASGQVW